MSGRLHVRVAIDRCVGSGICSLVAPDVFDQRDDDAVVVLREPDPPAERAEAVREAAARCPASVITVEQP